MVDELVERGRKRIVDKNLLRSGVGGNLESFHLSHGLRLHLGLEWRFHGMRKVKLQKADAAPKRCQCQTELPH
jgi:hypothetical protein